MWEMSVADVTIEWSNFNNEHSIAKVARFGPICELTLEFVPTASTIYHIGDELALVPSGYRPLLPIMEEEVDRYLGATRRIVVNTDGTILAQYDGTNTVERYHVFYFCA